MHRRTAIRVIGAAMAIALVDGCSQTTSGRPTVASITDRTAAGGSTSASTSTAPPTSTATSSATSSATPSAAADLSGGVTGTITWNTGSIPPPHNYTWIAQFTKTSGRLTLNTNYAADDQSWSETFTVTSESMAAFVIALAAAGVGAEGPPSDEHLVGGSSGSYELTTAGGTQLHASLGDSTATSIELGHISDAVQEFVGPEAWDSVHDSYQEWQTKQTS